MNARPTKPLYAPIPARAIGDDNLSSLDLRVLAVIAAHDRLGANGVGCYANHNRLAEIVGCHLKSLSRSLRNLGEGGYIEVAPHPLNRRLRVYRVVYNDRDHTIMKASRTVIGSSSVTNAGNQQAPTGNKTATVATSIGNHDFEKSVQDHSVTEVNIFRETENTSRRNDERDSAEAAPHKRRSLDLMDVGAVLALLERSLKSGELRAQSDLEVWREYCEQIEERLDHDDPNHQRALRLGGEIGARLE